MANSFLTLVDKYKEIFIILLLLWTFWTFGLGFLGGRLFRKGDLGLFPAVSSKNRILILAPHIDDENIAAGGLIQKAIAGSAKVKIVYLTNGDDSLFSVVEGEKKVDLSPEEFVALGEKRMEEGKKAMKTLGLGEDDLFFLGFPDRGLLPMFGPNFRADNPVVANGTRFNHSPYRGTYKAGELYAGENLVTDLKEIIEQFQPDIILSSHPRDKHPDHRATYQFLEKSLNGYSKKARVFACLVHFSGYPSSKRLKQNEFLYPPKKLFSQEGWFSYELSEKEEKGKLSAMEKYKSQKSPISRYDLLDSFVKRNEIFEEF